MISGQLISLASAALALATVCVAAWQVRASIKNVGKSNALPVIAEIFQEWRSDRFNSSLRRLLGIRNAYLMRKNFNALPRRLRRDAYEVCYFFDYLGTLVLHDIVSDDIVIGVMATRLVQVWTTMKPLILNEREHRLSHLPAGVPRGFLVYYEYLVKLVEAKGGENAARIAQQRAGVLGYDRGRRRNWNLRRNGR